jgi:hypothetical protein
MNEEEIKQMVDRFLAWPLPKDFAPDAGIVFRPSELQNSLVHPWPTGTNLLTAEQARQMILHMMGAQP